MQNDVMTDKFIDYVNDRIEDLDMTKSSLARSVGLDKNSVTKYLKKETDDASACRFENSELSEYGYQQNLRYSD
ncbi:MAG: hypothetical protein ACLTDX_15110 [[Clostridium] innocuum]